MAAVGKVGPNQFPKDSDGGDGVELLLVLRRPFFAGLFVDGPMVLLCLFCGVPRGFAPGATQEICAGLHGGRAAVSEGWHVVCGVGLGRCTSIYLLGYKIQAD